jgi:tripartite motif-containing protein 71
MLAKTLILTMRVAALMLPVSFATAGDPFEKQYPNIVEPVAQFGAFGRDLGQFNEPGRVAVSKSRLILVSECFNRRVQVLDDSGRTQYSFTGPADHPWSCPLSVAVSKDDRVFVGDRARLIFEFTIDGKFVQVIAFPQLVEPTAIAVSGNRLVVVDQPSDRVLVHNLATGATTSVTGRGRYTLRKPRSVAIDDDGALYVVDGAQRVVKFSNTLQPVMQWGSYGSFAGEMVDPSDIAYAEGKVYVADQTNHRLQAFTQKGEFVVQWGRHPDEEHAGRGRVHYPGAIAVDAEGKMAVVCEPFEYRCQIFDLATLRYVASNNVSAWWEKFPRFHYGGGARILRFSGMDVGTRARAAKVGANDILLITEPDLHRAVVFAIPDTEDLTTLSVVTTVGRFGEEPGNFVTISGKRPMTDGRMWIGDAGKNVVQEFDLFTGKYIRTMFGPGTGPGQFRGPSDMAIAADGRVFIGDFHNDRIQVFDKHLVHLSDIGGTGDALGKFFGPMSFQFSKDGAWLYVADTNNQRIQILDATTGRAVREFGRLTRPGEWGNGTFQWPFDLAVSPIDGSIYVTDPSLQLVQKFTPEGKFISQWGGWGTRPGEFYKPKGIDVDSHGRVFVIDFGNHRGQIFDADGKFLGIFGEGVLYPSKDLTADGKPITPAAK